MAIIDALPADSLKFISIVVLAEFGFGLRMAERAHSKRLVEFRSRIETVKRYAPLDLTRHTAAAYADLKSALAARVRRKVNQQRPARWLEDWVIENTDKQLQIDGNDLWIAAQAKERDLTLITGDRDLKILQAIDSELRVLLTCA